MFLSSSSLLLLLLTKTVDLRCLTSEIEIRDVVVVVVVVVDKNC